MKFTAIALSVLSTSGVLWAQDANWTEMAQRLGSGVAWFANDPRVLEEGRNREAVRASEKEHADFDRSQALERALAEAKRVQRPVLWFIPRILSSTEITSNGRQMYRPAVVERYARAVFFSDPDVTTLINRKFVAVRLICDEKLGERFGIRAPDVVEPAVLILSPDGTVLRRVDRIRSFQSGWFYRVLAHVLESHSELAGPSAELAAALAAEPVDSVALAEAAGLDGRDLGSLPAIAAGLEDGALARLALAHARSHRIRQRTTDALTLIDAAEQLIARVPPPENPNPRRSQVHPLLGEASCERGRVLLQDGRLNEAADAFQKVRSGARQAEAWFHLGLCEFFLGKTDLPRQRWKEAASLGADNPFAWRAAANLIDGEDRTIFGPTEHGFESPFATAAAWDRDGTTAQPRSPEEVQAMAEEGFRFLLRMQREHGGWVDSRYAYWPSPQITPNVWVSATSLAATALLEWRHLDPTAVDDALTRAERYMFDERNMNRGFQEEVYADAYKLIYLVRKHDRAQDEATRRESVQKMDQVVRALTNTQGSGERDRGFWGHEYPNPFTTAAIMNALHEAKVRGCAVPTALMHRGADALLTVRDEGGAFAYGAGRPPRGESETRMKDSMGRSPVCEAAILWAGNEAGNTEKVAAAMDNFWKNLPRLEKIRLCDFHTDGELGGFFFWHAVFHTTEAVKALPSADRPAHQQRMVEFLATLGEMDGSCLDSHEIGKSYGTAMGLLSIRNSLSPNN